MALHFAIHAHIFYPELWPELVQCIRNFPAEGTDVFLTFPDTLPAALEDNLRKSIPQATILRLENRGYDIGPFVEVVHRLNLNAYDFVIKLHTKRNRRAIVKFLPYWGSQWRRKLLAFCATRAAVQRTIDIFLADPQIGMIGNGDLIMHASDELIPNGMKTPPDQNHAFVAGTMFAVRAPLLKRLVSEVAFSDFPIMEGRSNSENAWAWERKLGTLVEEQDYRITGFPRTQILTRIAQHFAKFAYKAYRHLKD